jgi:hypothetical protein
MTRSSLGKYEQESQDPGDGNPSVACDRCTADRTEQGVKVHYES